MQKRSNHIQGRQLLPVDIAFTTEQSIFIPLFFADPTKKRQIVWELTLQNGEKLWGKAKRNAISIQRLPEGIHQLTVIVGMPLLSLNHKIYQCNIQIGI
ncbi:4-alpha-glucanotransferase [Actinobacillus indolicus]|nr:4-alpha-glucanotransferase [Actinobacillus indolicus]VTU06753.1 4-alpha-glucanotransferase [Actinobacillus indolicus]